MDLAEVEDIKKRCQEYREEVYKKKKKKDLMIWITMRCDNSPRLDILEREVKWALGRMTMEKASGCDDIRAELFQILKYDAVKVLHST